MVFRSKKIGLGKQVILRDASYDVTGYSVFFKTTYAYH